MAQGNLGSYDFFKMFLADLDRSTSVQLVTTAQGVTAVEQVSALAATEFANYQLIEVDPIHMHDRNLIIDDKVFSLGPGADKAGMALSNFDPADSSQVARDEFEKIINSGRVVHRS